jgi:3-oxoadipate enol-lactonase
MQCLPTGPPVLARIQEGVTSMRITANGIAINYELEGPANAPVVTLSHSLATNLSMWDPQIPALASRYRVLRYDTRGHGGTDAPGGAYSLDLLAEDLRELLRALRILRTHFVGLSMGGMIGQLLGIQSPELLESLTLCDTSSRIPADARPMWEERIRMAEAQGMEPHIEPTIGRWFTPSFRQQHPAALDPVRAMIRSTNPAGYAGCCHAIKTLDLTDRIAAIATRTLIIVGEDDVGTPVAASRTIHERIRGSQLVILKSASHLSNIEQASAFNEALLAFLATRA